MNQAQPGEPLTTQDQRHAWRCQLPASPYRRGFEDTRYNHIYANPYRPGSPAWHKYDAGNQDARKDAPCTPNS